MCDLERPFCTSGTPLLCAIWDIPFCTCLRVRGRSGPAGLRQACVGDDGAFFRVGTRVREDLARGGAPRRPFGRGCARKAVPYRAFRRSLRNAPDDVRKGHPRTHIG